MNLKNAAKTATEPLVATAPAVKTPLQQNTKKSSRSTSAAKKDTEPVVVTEPVVATAPAVKTPLQQNTKKSSRSTSAAKKDTEPVVATAPAVKTPLQPPVDGVKTRSSSRKAEAARVLNLKK